jgi:hypothetical protein
VHLSSSEDAPNVITYLQPAALGPVGQTYGMPKPETDRRVRSKCRDLVSPRSFERFLNGVIPPERRAELQTFR